jgi:hypothetical protein
MLIPVPTDEKVLVRVSFNVVPKNGTQLSTIIKTFVANVVGN